MKQELTETAFYILQLFSDKQLHKMCTSDIETPTSCGVRTVIRFPVNSPAVIVIIRRFQTFSQSLDLPNLTYFGQIVSKL